MLLTCLKLFIFRCIFFLEAIQTSNMSIIYFEIIIIYIYVYWNTNLINRNLVSFKLRTQRHKDVSSLNSLFDVNVLLMTMNYHMIPCPVPASLYVIVATHTTIYDI